MMQKEDAPSGRRKWSLRWSPRVSDDEGTHHRLTAIETSDPALRPVIARLTTHLVRDMFTTRNVIAYLLLGVVFLIPGLVALELFMRHSGFDARFVVFVVFGAVLAIGSMMAGRRRLARESGAFVSTLLGMGRCGSCGYQLKDLPQDADGRCTCPECGAVWRSERVGVPGSSSYLHVPGGTSTAETEDVASKFTGDLRTVFAAWSGRRTVVDARGRIVALVSDPRLRGRRPPLTSEESQTLRRVLTGASIPRRRSNILIIGGFSLIPLGMTALLIAEINWTGGWRDLTELFLPVISLALGGAMVWYTWRLATGRTGYETGALVRALLAAGHCPACGQSIHSPDATDAVRGCEACGAAWSAAADDGPNG